MAKREAEARERGLAQVCVWSPAGGVSRDSNVTAQAAEEARERALAEAAQSALTRSRPS